MAKPPKFDISGAKKELNARREFDQHRRDNANNILRPEQIQGKDWRSAKVLTTTLGLANGQMRRITKQDLIAFNKNIARLESRIEKGVTANEVISLSMPEDKKRSKEQIHFAVPVTMRYGDIKFLTNAGPDSKVTRHSVHIVLADYDHGLAKGTPLQAAKEISKGNLLFDCDCDHHTFVFRYITTIMRANAGRPEHGFPKLRNPQLEGIACKHVLRVMTELNSSIFIWKKIATMIESDRANNASKELKRRQKTVAMTQREATEMAAKQKLSPRKIEAINKASKASNIANAVRTAARMAPPPSRPKRASMKQANDAATILAATGMTMEQIVAMIAAQRG
ncbi:hypothetical protein A1507_19565 [Methylomonas koyamae]|uniref:SWIM-type domain-containing protein n=1 Tax=Methylomonas koyamae TaxID=702114 RepID=A0A177N1Q8_9GAMM|nr:hypothetical protein [Methylomonas koyamae]OAI11907.1 hypothetical protein A1507_19565 [Methylomonas koyamae]